MKSRLILICITGIIFILLTLRPDDRVAPPPTANSSRSCDSLPAAVAAVDLAPEVLKPPNAPLANLQVHNLRDHPVVFVLTAGTGGHRLKAVSIPPQLAANLYVPIGHYGAEMLVGSNWCNLQTGFLDGRKIHLNGIIAVELSKISEFRLAQNGLQPEAFSINLIVRGAPSKISAADGDAMLQMEDDGHFHINGAINGIQTRFLVDTGASSVAISRKLAIQAGISECTPVQTTTANGKVEGCKATMNELVFGPYRMQHIEVFVMQDLPGDSLLGMNVLREFKITQDGQQMVLVAKNRP